MFVCCSVRVTLWYTNLLLNIYNEHYLMVSLSLCLSLSVMVMVCATHFSGRSFLSLQIILFFIMIMNILEIFAHYMLTEQRRSEREGERKRETAKCNFDENVILSLNYSQPLVKCVTTNRCFCFCCGSEWHSSKRNQFIAPWRWMRRKRRRQYFDLKSN